MKKIPLHQKKNFQGPIYKFEFLKTVLDSQTNPSDL